VLEEEEDPSLLEEDEDIRRAGMCEEMMMGLMLWCRCGSQGCM